ncbi:type II secretion system secretin GspD, partial [bacterium]|nr:type II secretion system secretin GspD [bacterium]
MMSFSSASMAQDDSEERFTLNMREADIRAFIQWVADRTGRSMVVHKNVQGSVTVLSQQEVTSDEAYELFLTILEVHGYTAVDTGTAIKVIPDTDAKSSTTPLAEQLKQAGSEPVTGILRVDNVDAAQMVGLLRPLIPASGHIAAFPKTNALIITDTAANLNRIRGIVKKLDKSGEIDIEIVRLKHASANDIVNTLKALVPRGAAGGAEGGGGNEVSFAVDERSNAILMTGDGVKRAHLKRIIRRLDTPLDGEGNTQVVYLNYIEAAEVVPILKSVGDSMLKEAKAEQKNFSIEQSETTNALVISAPPALLNNLRSIIAQLDIRRAQVLVEAIVAQVSYDDDNDMGVVWGTANIVSADPDGSFATVNGLSGTASLTLPSTTDDGEGGVVTNLSQALLANRGLTFGYLKDGDLLAAIRAISSERSTNILSTPTIVALDNEEASLLVGQNVPFITGSSTSAATPNSNPFTTIQRQDVGITLNVTPRINQGDSITLDITQSSENVVQDKSV